MTPKEIVEIVSHGITAVATVSAGAWAYYRFVKGRVFKPRLILSASARRVNMESNRYVLSSVELSNVGLSRVDIDSAILRISALSSGPFAEVSVPSRTWLGTSRVLLAHTWIESGEVLKAQTLLALPAGDERPAVVDYKVVVGDVSFRTEAFVVPPADASQKG